MCMLSFEKPCQRKVVQKCFFRTLELDKSLLCVTFFTLVRPFYIWKFSIRIE